MCASHAATQLQPTDTRCLLQDLPYDLHVTHVAAHGHMLLAAGSAL